MRILIIYNQRERERERERESLLIFNSIERIFNDKAFFFLRA